METKFYCILIMFVHSSLSFGLVDSGCDPENAANFINFCGRTQNKTKPRVQKISLWQGTDHPGYQLIDCEHRKIKNVIEKTGESYSCQMKVEQLTIQKEIMNVNPTNEEIKPKESETINTIPKNSSKSVSK